MTTAKKWLIGVLTTTALLGGGGFGAYTYHQRELKNASEQASKALWTSRCRSLLLEAALATRYGNYAMAFERTVRAHSISGRLGLSADKEYSDVEQLLIQQRPDIEVATRLVMIADKVEPPAPLGPPDPARKGAAPGTSEQIGISAAKPAPPPAAQPPAAAAVPSPATPQAPQAAAPPQAPAAAPPTSPGSPAPALPRRGQTTEASMEEGRQALGQAKVQLIAGKEAAVVLEWLARAQVVLDESGKNEVSESISSAIKAVRGGDEAKAQKSIDAALTKLRGQ